MRLAAFRVTMLDTSTVTSTTMSVAFKSGVSNSPMSTPIVTAASVAAACASERPKRSRPCGRLRPSKREETMRRGQLPDEHHGERDAARSRSRGAR